MNNFKYAMRNRPFSLGTAPKGQIAVEDATKQYKHGVVVYDRELTVDEVNKFELQAIYPKHIMNVALTIVSSMKKYSEKYLADESLLSNAVWSKSDSYYMQVEKEKMPELIDLVVLLLEEKDLS